MKVQDSVHGRPDGVLSLPTPKEILIDVSVAAMIAIGQMSRLRCLNILKGHEQRVNLHAVFKLQVQQPTTPCTAVKRYCVQSGSFVRSQNGSILIAKD